MTNNVGRALIPEEDRFLLLGVLESRTASRWTVVDYGLVAAASGMVLLLGWFEPSVWGRGASCSFRKATGWFCPGCGSTRALHHLLNGDIVSAFQANPLLIAGLPLLGVATGWWYSGAGRKRVLPVRPWVLAVGVLAVLVLFGFLRNLQSSPFAWMAP